MKFGPVPIEEAEDKILGHNVAGADGRRAFRKGKPLTAEDVATLRDLGRETVYVAELEPGDVDEDTAAQRIAQTVMGTGLRLSGPSTGRANLYVTTLGLVRVNGEGLAHLNACAGVTVATLPGDIPAQEGTIAATVKILPYAIPGATVAAAEGVAREHDPILAVDPLPARTVSLILSGSPAGQERVVRSFESALAQRLEALGSAIATVDFVPLEEEADEAALANTIRQRAAEGSELIILAGETAIMDRHDITPRAVERAGGEITCFGAPVDPGNLLMLAYLDEVPVLGAPGCARSPKDNIVDLVLPRLLVGDRPGRGDIIALGHGGLLEDVPERPSPRSRIL